MIYIIPCELTVASCFTASSAPCQLSSSVWADFRSFYTSFLKLFHTGEYLGRKKTIIIGVIIMSIGAILQTTAYSVPHIIVARLVTGVGNG